MSVKDSQNPFGRALPAAESGGGGTPGGSDKQVQYNNAGAFGGITMGANGTVLTSDGTNAAFATPSGGGALVLLEQHTASGSASLDFTSWYSSTYDDYLIEIVSLVAATNTAAILLRVSVDGGSTYETTNYIGNVLYTPLAGGAAVGVTFTNGIQLINSYGTGVTRDVLSGRVRMWNPGDSTLNKLFTIDAVGPSSGGGFWSNRGGVVFNSASAVNALQAIASSGNLDSGTVRIYGYTK